jgi:hypothetical protein
MNKNLLIPLGIFVFAITLAIVLRDSLSGEAALIAVGIAIGLAIGVPAGMLSMTLAGRWNRSVPPPVSQSSGLTLSPEQTELLLKAIERQQASPAGFGLAARETRSFTSVGGANVADLSGEPQDRS